MMTKKTHDSFLQLTDRVEQHLAMVFHRFLEGPKPEFNIFINGTSEAKSVKDWDPFMKNHSFTDCSPLESIPTSVGSLNFKVMFSRTKIAWIK